jgi:integrase
MPKNNMGRTRLLSNKSLERYVKRDKRGYVWYKHPQMDKPQHFGKDVAAANEVAKIINAQLSSQSDIISKILAPTRNGFAFREVIEAFEKERIPHLDWSERYGRENIGRLATMCAAIGDSDFPLLSVLQINDLIDSNFSGDGRRMARNVLIHVYRFAIGKGLHTGSNVAEQMLEVPKAKRIRQRISNFNDFEAIRALAAPWLQNAMDLSLITLQARQEICDMRLKQDEGDVLRVIRQKTAKKTDTANIEIEVGSDLRKVLTRCKVEALMYGSPFMINYPSRGVSAHKAHRCQVLPRFLSGAFKDLIDSCELYAETPEQQRPTFHEIRSLGGRLYKAMGMSEEFIQRLYGHAKVGMTEHYLEGDKIVWTKANACMDLSLAATVSVNE